MSTTHVAWGSIELLHNCVRTLTHLHEQGEPFPIVEYRAKVKLHGTNCAVQITSHGIVPQSRNQLLSVEADHKGFARWVDATAAYWRSLPVGSVVFGEWCGPGVEKGMAISQAKTKLFAVFAIQHDDRMLDDPAEIRAQLPAGEPEQLHVLPWEGEAFTIDFASRPRLDEVARELNDRVANVEREDPWCKRVLGISGLGEGLVLYPLGVADAAKRSVLMFKAKGDKHRTAGKRAVQVDATAAASIEDFVALVVTDARLHQGVAQVGGSFDPKQTGAFVAWIAADVKKESVAELEASGLTWAQTERAVQAAARSWYLKGGVR
jgi:hypothetical protein